MKSLISGPCLLVHAIAATEPGARPPDQAAEGRRQRRAAVVHGAGMLKEESTQVVLVKSPGTLAAGLKHEVFVALSDKRAAQPQRSRER